MRNRIVIDTSNLSELSTEELVFQPEHGLLGAWPIRPPNEHHQPRGGVVLDQVLWSRLPEWVLAI